MKRTILAAVLLAGTALASPASAVDFTLSDGHGSGPFGTVTGFFINAQDTAYVLDFNMTPNNIINTGSHYPLTLSLNTGSITATATTFAGLGLPGSPFTVLTHTDPATYKNAPFDFFTDAVDGACGNGNSSGGCGSNLWIEVTGVNPNAVGGLFNPATNQFNGFDVFAAVDIYNTSSGKTFAVGLAAAPIPTQFSAVPGPIVGAGIPGLIAACGALFGFNWRRRRRLQGS